MRPLTSSSSPRQTGRRLSADRPAPFRAASRGRRAVLTHRAAIAAARDAYDRGHSLVAR
jgi:hypothetical protein